jgi:RNA polymerase sigma-70 factor (ECF subfamily)
MHESAAEDLIRKIKLGDTEALGQFLELKRGALLGFIDRELGPGLRRKVEPEDIFQEAAAEAIKGIATAFDDPFGWMCRICEQKVIDAYRRFFGAAKRNAAREVSADSPAGDSSQAGIANLLVASMTSPSAVFSRDAKHLKMLQALEQISEDQREALRLRYFEGLSSGEIAERLGKSNGAVRVMLSRSLSQLQDLLGSDAAPR